MKASKDNLEWERAIVRELNREHEHCCRLHRVKLRPIAIVLFESETRWGQFDGRARTISISSRLIIDFPWHNVVGVLRHEMAHQLVAEEGRSNDRTPHSEPFKEACRRLGVPAQYARAGVDLQSCSLDWRDEPRDEAVEKILDRVKKLLALANSSNEHEALLAMARVRELYAKYNLEHAARVSSEAFVHSFITHGKKRMQSWERRTISILSEHFFVTVLIFRQFDAKTREAVHALEIIGTRENVLMAEYVYHFLLEQTESLLKTASQSGAKLAGPQRKSFRLGVLDGFARKLKSAESMTVNESQNGHCGGRELTMIGKALQIFHNDDQLDNYLDQIHPRLSRRHGPSIRVDDGAYAAGQVAGRSITLHKPITSQSEGRGKVIAARSTRE